MKYRIFKISSPDPDYPWIVDEGIFCRSAHATWADAMQAVDEAYRTIEVTLPPCRGRYTTEDIGKNDPVFVENSLNGWANIGYTAGGMWVALRPGELEPVALALLAIDKHNKEARA